MIMKKIISIALSLAMLLSAVGLTACKKDDKPDGTAVVVTTENFSINQGMFAYFFNVTYSGYKDYLDGLGVNGNIPLKEQECPYVLKGDKTWFTYFVEMTKDYVAQMLALCQEAHNAGMTLDEEEIKRIDSYMADIVKAAESHGSGVNEYVSLVVNNPFTAADLRKCLEMDMLAAKYEDEFFNNISISDEEMEAYYLANSSRYDTMDMYAFTTIAEEENIEIVREEMNALLATETAEEYLGLVRGFIESDYAKNDIEIDDEAREAIEAFVDSCEYTGIVPSDFILEESAEWAITAKTGDTYLEEHDKTFTVFMVIREMSRNETLARNVRHVLFSNDTYDDDTIPARVYSEWGETGFTEERIIELAKKYSQDEGSSENGGLYTNVTRGDMVTEFDEWLFDESRRTGDHAIIETEFGWHLMYYVSENDIPVWKSDVISDLANEKYNDMIDKYYFALEYNEEAIAEIDA